MISHTASLRGIRAARRVYSDLPWERIGRVEQRHALASCDPRQHIDFDYLRIKGFWEGLPTERLDVLLSDCKHVSQRASVSCHVFSKPLPAGALMRVEQGLYACSPEFTALLYARGRTMPEVLVLLMELLGTYGLPEEATLPIAWGGYWPDAADDRQVQQAHYQCRPATTLKKLKAMADWATGSSFLSFRQAVRYAAKGSASPAETIAYAMFGLPMSYGGFNMCKLAGGILLNHRLYFDERAMRMASGMPYAVCDAFIPVADTDLEYNGIGHEEPSARIHDGQRNNGLRGMGVKVVVINRDQMRDIVALEAIAQSIYRDAGVRFRYQVAGYRRRQASLLNALRRAAGMRPV